MRNFEVRLRAALEGYRPRREEQRGARAAAVLIPVLAEPEPTLIFTVRTEHLPSHKGQISFPGGSIDATDDSAEAAALRETHEEIGLRPADVRVLGELDTFPTYVTGYLITPFVGWLDKRVTLRPNPAEVAEVLEVPITDLVDDIRAEPGFTHGGRTFPTEAWIWNDRVIWGVTARVLRVFLHLLAEAGLAKQPGGTPWWEAGAGQNR